MHTKPLELDFTEEPIILSIYRMLKSEGAVIEVWHETKGRLGVVTSIRKAPPSLVKDKPPRYNDFYSISYQESASWRDADGQTQWYMASRAETLTTRAMENLVMFKVRDNEYRITTPAF